MELDLRSPSPTPRRRRVPLAAALLVLIGALAPGCSPEPAPGGPEPHLPPGATRTGTEISICGELEPIGTPVVLWTDPSGYDAYAREPFAEASAAQRALVRSKPSFHPEREGYSAETLRRIRASGVDRAALAELVDLFVIHFDACGTSRQCFRVLHDERRLSVHFLLDLDGTIYQTLDVRERAWHAGTANDRSVGVEIANIGCYPRRDHALLQSWYARDSEGTRVVFPRWMHESGIRTVGFVPRPARDELLSGTIHGKRYWQYDFTPEQYRALARLAAGLHRALPKLALEAPRGKDGRVADRVLSAPQLAAHRGLVGHFHVNREKQDPGPAFDWEGLLAEARSWAIR